MSFKVGDKVLLHSRGGGKWFPVEERTVTSVRAGIVHIDDPDKVPFKLDGQEAKPGQYKFRFYIERKPCSTTYPAAKRKRRQ